MDIKFKARAVCNHDAKLVAAALTKKNARGKKIRHNVKNVSVSGCILSFTVVAGSASSEMGEGLHTLCLVLSGDDALLDCHRLVGTVAVADGFTGEVISDNYAVYDQYLAASKMSLEELLTAAFE